MCSHFLPLVHTLTYIQVQKLHSRCWNFNNGIYHVVKTNTAESNPDMGLLIEQTLCLSLTVLARANKTPVTTLSAASDLGHTQQ